MNMMDRIVPVKPVDEQEQIIPQRTSSRRTKGGIHSYAEEELEPENPHSDDDGDLTFTSTRGITTTATINDTPVEVFVLGPCTLTGEEVGTDLGTYMHAKLHNEDTEFSSRKMDNIDFIQNVEAYNTFINEHGIEPSNSMNKNLYRWHKKLCQAYRMRRDNVSGKSPIVLTDERLSILRAASINIIPLQTLDRTADSHFMANVKEYKAFREVHGRAPSIHENSGLFHWCSEVRIGYCKKREQGLEVNASNGVEITVDREALLRSIGFDLVLPVSTDKKPSRHFADRIESIKRYKEKHGHLNPRKSDGDGDDESKSLYNFIIEVRTSYRKRLDEHQPKNEKFKLTDYRYDALNTVGFPFKIMFPISSIEPAEGKPTDLGTYVYATKPHEDAKRKMNNVCFIQNVEAYNAFISEHGIEPSNSTNKKLYEWHNNLCQAYRRRYDNDSRKSVGIVLSDERLYILRAARINIPLQTLDKTADSLFMTLDRTADSLTMTLDRTTDSFFMANFEKYKAFREVHGRAPYIHENLDMFHWCSEVRIGYKKRKQGLVEVIASNGVEITVGREALLRSIGFDFVLPYSTERKQTDHLFADRIKALKQYKEKHGHLNPSSSVGNGSRPLYKFITEVRSSYHNQLHQIKNKRIKFTDDRYDALNAIGFPFKIVYPISPIEPEGKPSPSQAAKPKLKPRVPTKAKRRSTPSQAAKPSKLKPSVPTKAKHIRNPSQPATSKHATPPNRYSRIKRKPVTYEEDFDDSLIGEVSGSKRRRSLDPSSIVSIDNTSMSSSMISLDRSLLLSAITPLQSIVRDEFKCPVCLNACQDPYVVPECLHRFCGDCIGQSIRKCGTRCPECRTPIIAKRHLRPDTQFAKIMKTVLDSIQILESMIGANDGTVKVSNCVDRLRKIGGTGEPHKLPPPSPCPPCCPPQPNAQASKTNIPNNHNGETLISIAKSAFTPSSITISKKRVAPIMNTKGVKRNPIPFVSRLEEIKKFIEENGHSDVPRIHENSHEFSTWCYNVRYSYNKIIRGLPPIYELNEDRIAGLTAIGFDFNFPKDRSGKLSNAKGTSNDGEVLVAATIDAVVPAVTYTKTRNQHSYREGNCNEGTAADKIDLVTNAAGVPNRGRISNQAFELKIEELKDYRRLNGHLKIKRTKKKALYYTELRVKEALRQKKQGASMCSRLTEERENTLRAVGLKDPCSKEKGTVSSMGADIGPRNAGNGKTHQLPTKVGTTNEQRNECKNSSCNSSLRSIGDPICSFSVGSDGDSVCDSLVGSDGDSENDSSTGSTSTSVQPTTPPRRRHINSNRIMVASISGPRWTRRVDRMREARKRVRMREARKHS